LNGHEGTREERFLDERGDDLTGANFEDQGTPPRKAHGRARRKRGGRGKAAERIGNKRIVPSSGGKRKGRSGGMPVQTKKNGGKGLTAPISPVREKTG